MQREPDPADPPRLVFGRCHGSSNDVLKAASRSVVVAGCAPFLSVVGVIVVGLLAVGNAEAQGQSGCEAALMAYPADVVQDSWVRVEVQNQGPPTQVTMCVVEREGWTNRAIHSAVMPAADLYTHTFRVVPGEFIVHLRVFDPSGTTGTGASIRADLEECLGVLWRPEVTYVAGSLIYDMGTIDCEEAVPPAQADRAPAKGGPRLVALPWNPASSFATHTTEGPPVWAWALVAAPVGFLAWYRNLAWFLFTRIARPDLLDQRHRARIVDLVRADPGIHFEEIGRRLELANGAVRHHLVLLLRNTLLIEVRVHGKRCLFVPEAGHRSDLEARATLTVPTARRVFEFLQQGPNRLEEIARAAKISTSQARRWLRELATFGLVEDRVVGGRKEFWLRGSQPDHP